MRRVRLSWGWGAGTAVVLELCTSAGAQPVTHRLEVNRFVGTPFTASEADEILAEAGRVLTVDDDNAGPDDTPCEVEFHRRGTIGTFTRVGAILSPPELRTVRAEDGDAEDRLLLPGAVGRQDLHGGQDYEVARPGRGALWAHEFGHTQRLSLTGNHPRSTPAVMTASVAAANRHVDEGDCSAFRRSPNHRAALLTPPSTGQVALPCSSQKPHRPLWTAEENEPHPSRTRPSPLSRASGCGTHLVKTLRFRSEIAHISPGASFSDGYPTVLLDSSSWRVPELTRYGLRSRKRRSGVCVQQATGGLRYWNSKGKFNGYPSRVDKVR